jgi:hypothetical protein
MPAKPRSSEVTVSKPARRLVHVAIAMLIPVAALLAACGTTPPTGTAAPSSASPASATPSPPATLYATYSPSSEPPSTTPTSSSSGTPTQSTVEWGRIWDALPAGFPRPAGATATEIGDPASGAFVLPEDVLTASSVMQGALPAAGFRTEGVSGPLEDGSVVIDSVGSKPACRVQTTIARRGAVTMMTVLYGASCPFD